MGAVRVRKYAYQKALEFEKAEANVFATGRWSTMLPFPPVLCECPRGAVQGLMRHQCSRVPALADG